MHLPIRVVYLLPLLVGRSHPRSISIDLIVSCCPTESCPSAGHWFCHPQNCFRCCCYRFRNFVSFVCSYCSFSSYLMCRHSDYRFQEGSHCSHPVEFLASISLEVQFSGCVNFYDTSSKRLSSKEKMTERLFAFQCRNRKTTIKINYIRYY